MKYINGNEKSDKTKRNYKKCKRERKYKTGMKTRNKTRIEFEWWKRKFKEKRKKKEIWKQELIKGTRKNYEWRKKDLQK